MQININGMVLWIVSLLARKNAYDEIKQSRKL